MTWPIILIVGVGGAAGAISRFIFTQAFVRLGTAFPIGTLGVNSIGCLLMGIFLAAALHFPGLENWRPLIAAGFLGGFTTFSAFSADIFTLTSQNRFGTAIAYFALTNALGIVALLLGYWMTQKGLGN